MPRRLDMQSLFTEVEQEAINENAPLAVRMRPRTLDELIGQDEAVGPGTWLRHAIEADELSAIILYGPAGTGKTSLARVIANVTQAEFVEVSAVTGSVADLRREIRAASERLAAFRRRTILFVDEIHRFSRSQQDALLHAVENATVVLVGATTENPFFEVNSALISRSRVVELHSLTDEDLSCSPAAMPAPPSPRSSWRASWRWRRTTCPRRNARTAGSPRPAPRRSWSPSTR